MGSGLSRCKNTTLKINSLVFMRQNRCCSGDRRLVRPGTGNRSAGLSGGPGDLVKRPFSAGGWPMVIELNPVLGRFTERTPLPVMARAVLERCLNPQELDAWFEQVAEAQYTRQLLFSTLFDLMSQVVLRQQPSVHAAYRAAVGEIGVSVASVYNKLNGVEIGTSAALVDYSGAQAAALLDELGGSQPPLLAGVRVKVLDGNALAGREH